MKKTLTMVLALALVFAMGIGATLAWLTDTTGEVQNTFTTTDVDIELTETEGGDEKEFEMVPGKTIDKNPKVTVSADSEDCYVFVKVTESSNLDDYISYSINDDVWTALPGEDGVYYLVVDTEAEKNVAHSVLKGDTVTVLEDVTKDDMTAAESAKPTLTFQAYAIQMDYLTNNNVAVTDAAGAWTLLSGLN